MLLCFCAVTHTLSVSRSRLAYHQPERNYKALENAGIYGYLRRSLSLSGQPIYFADHRVSWLSSC